MSLRRARAPSIHCPRLKINQGVPVRTSRIVGIGDVPIQALRERAAAEELKERAPFGGKARYAAVLGRRRGCDVVHIRAGPGRWLVAAALVAETVVVGGVADWTYRNRSVSFMGSILGWARGAVQFAANEDRWVWGKWDTYRRLLSSWKR